VAFVVTWPGGVQKLDSLRRAKRLAADRVARSRTRGAAVATVWRLSGKTGRAIYSCDVERTNGSDVVCGETRGTMQTFTGARRRRRAR